MVVEQGKEPAELMQALASVAGQDSLPVSFTPAEAFDKDYQVKRAPLSAKCMVQLSTASTRCIKCSVGCISILLP